ncbi:MAG: AraC family transcriptional regulator [Pseudomonadota bacterium]
MTHQPTFLKFTDAVGLGAQAGGRGFDCTSLPITMARFQIETHQSVGFSNSDHMLILCNGSQGDLSAEIGGDTNQVSTHEGMLTFAPRGAEQKYDFKGHTDNTLLTLDADFVSNIAGEWEPSCRKVSLDTHIGFLNSRMSYLIKDLLRTVNTADAGWRIMAEAAAMQIGVELLKHFIGRKKVARSNKLDDDDVKMLTEFVEAYLDWNISLTDLAAAMDMEMFAFSRAFKAKTGTTPAQFVIQRRMMRASEMLENTDTSLAEIAYSCGFSSQSHMTSTFSRLVGQTPGRYRKEVRA